MIRNWIRETDSGAVHVMGNGNTIVYGIGPEISQVIAYPISADSFCSLTLPDTKSCVCQRLDKTAIWRHTLDNNTVITDLVDIDVNCYQRQIVTVEPLKMILQINPVYTFSEDLTTDQMMGFEAKDGVRFFVYEVDVHPCRYVKVSGNVQITKLEEGVYQLLFGPGCSSLYISDSPASVEEEAHTPFDTSLARVGTYWQEFLSQMKPFPKWLADICENVGILIKSQQASDGAILAGYAYHLAYVRDQYGTARGLLSMGFCREVEKMMYFYKMYFDRYGVIHNAQSIDHYGVFHIHENDNVEITGYLAILPFSVYHENHNEAFMQDMLPMIRWCLEKQVQELQHNMLPFNGDETYIAGGFLPRYAMYDGSAEATMLLAKSIELYRSYTGDTQYDEILTQIRKTYLSNFVRNGRLMANIPERMSTDQYPKMRRGVCEDCRDFMVDLYCTQNHRYVCHNCLSHDPLPKREIGSMELTSSKLISLYIDSDLVPQDMLYAYLEEMAQSYREDKQMPSGCPDGHAVGYDYGLFLYALTKLGHPLSKEICNMTLSVIDETGAWCEYYQNGIPWNTRCRPWESAINIEGIISFYEKYPN